MKELFRNFDFNEAPAEMITTVCGMELPEEEVYCQIDSCSISDDAFFDVSGSLEEFVRKLG